MCHKINICVAWSVVSAQWTYLEKLKLRTFLRSYNQLYESGCWLRNSIEENYKVETKKLLLGQLAVPPTETENLHFCTWVCLSHLPPTQCLPSVRRHKPAIHHGFHIPSRMCCFSSPMEQTADWQSSQTPVEVESFLFTGRVLQPGCRVLR